MDEVIKIVNDIKAGNIKPIYFLMGEEPYYIDKISDFIQENILQEEEKEILVGFIICKSLGANWSCKKTY